MVTGTVRTWLRLEGLAMLAVAVTWYAAAGHGWGMFAMFFLAPDVSFAGYLGGARVGAVVYNVAHAAVLPFALACAGLLWWPQLLPAAAIWDAHIGFDRMLGYGLKYPSAFGDTHLGRIGRDSDPGRAGDT